MQSIINNLLVEYDTTGESKEFALLLHGWGSNKESFGLLKEYLSASYTVVSVDLPGFGASQIPGSPWGIAEYAQFVVDFCEKLKINPSVIVGHSMGGRIAIYLGSEQKFSSAKLILLGAAGFNESSSAKNQAFKAIAKTGKTITKPLPKKLQNKLKGKLYSAAGTTDYVDSGELKEIFSKVVDLDLTEHAKKVMNQTLLIYGENDEATPPRYGEKYNQLIENSTLHIIASAAHYVHNDQPGQVHDLISGFMS